MDAVDGTSNLILLNIGYTELNANWNWTNIHSPFARIYYVTGGEARIRIGDRTQILKPGYLYLIPPFTLHNDECDSYFSLYYIHFYQKAVNQESVFDKYDFPLEVQATHTDILLAKRLTEINPGRHLMSYDPQSYDNLLTFSKYIADNKKIPIHLVIESQGILLQYLSRFLESAKVKSLKKDERINRCIKYIHENFDKDLLITDLADVACLSENHFIRLFKKEMDVTPLKYINLKKIEKAQLLLLTTNRQVRDIALELLIDNISYFNRIFKQYTGKTPVQFRQESNRQEINLQF
ncbi:AraC family transcriptional regulator [Dysgonomonas sp. 216]|uniref:AraC family transcriptional regulator n=1 Tax=Dysgonomonas sp. 216 TaxID=2302934 RepID=UPI0013CF8B01|nr:AraC family transcriptional regulator [Dysgonomonas sp. 216]NDW17895.1 AraC family transcriptional regulator [Dysgonomonas sp. 216]